MLKHKENLVVIKEDTARADRESLAKAQLQTSAYLHEDQSQSASLSLKSPQKSQLVEGTSQKQPQLVEGTSQKQSQLMEGTSQKQSQLVEGTNKRQSQSLSEQSHALAQSTVINQQPETPKQGSQVSSQIDIRSKQQSQILPQRQEPHPLRQDTPKNSQMISPQGPPRT